MKSIGKQINQLKSDDLSQIKTFMNNFGFNYSVSQKLFLMKETHEFKSEIGELFKVRNNKGKFQYAYYLQSLANWFNKI